MSDTEFIKEVEDDLRDQRLQAFWKEYGGWIIGSALLAVVMTGALTVWDKYKLSQNQQATERLADAVRENSAEKLASFANDQGGTHAGLARLTEAGLLAQQGKTEDAVKVYESIASSRSVETIYRDLASLLALSYKIDNAKTDDVMPEINRLTAVKNPWRYSALELKALVLARDKKFDEAVTVLESIISDAQAPFSLKTRAFSLRDLYKASSNDTSKKEKRS